jgi:hypothetical protein
MTKYILLASAAAALALTPTVASASQLDPGGVSLTFSNDVSASSDADYDYTIDTTITGTVYVTSVLDPDSAASAQTDAKQIMFGNIVSFDDPSQFAEDGPFPDEDMGLPGHVANTAAAGPVTSSGNTGVNVAAGQYNMQQNSANLSVSGNSNAAAIGGWANASTTGYQSLVGTLYGTPGGAQPGGVGEVTNYYDTNVAAGGAVSSNGNVGENVAAGAFNQQQNLLTIAVANNSILSETSAALWQNSNCNSIGIQNETNTATSGAISGNGNLGVNIAAGVGNQQTNALTAAVSNATGTVGAGGGGGTGI